MTVLLLNVSEFTRCNAANDRLILLMIRLQKKSIAVGQTMIGHI